MAVGDSPSSSSGTTLSASYRLSASGRLLLPLLSPPLLVAVLLAASLPLPAGCLPAPRLTLPAPLRPCLLPENPPRAARSSVSAGRRCRAPHADSLARKKGAGGGSLLPAFPRGGARLGAALLRPIGRIRGCADPRPLRRGLLRALLSLAVHQVARAGGFAALGAPAGLAPSPRPAVLLLPVRETLIALSRLRVRRGARAFPGPCVGVPGTGTAPAPPAAPPPSSLPVRVAARQGSRACSTAGFLPSAVGRPARRRKPEAQRSGFLATRACCAGGPFGGPWLQVPVRGRAVRPAVQLKPRGLPAPHWGEGHRRFRQLAVKVRNPKLSLQGALLCRELSIALLRCLTQRVLRKKQRRQVALVRVPHHRIRGLAKHSSGRCVLLYEPAQVVCSTADLGQPGEQPVKREALRLNHRRCFFTLHSNRLKTRLHFVVV
mmetsp:Transcript_605/g.1444  ORF Transcript_605/g.1444 Transcript_605/m.1444 type:complete len:433 (+) Transcript_605:832-2130(+)